MQTRYSATCTHVWDGDTFKTEGDNWIRLDNVCAPDEGESGYLEAKNILKNLILNEQIVYEPTGRSYDRTVAEVWVGQTYVNGYMRSKGYTCPS